MKRDPFPQISFGELDARRQLRAQLWDEARRRARIDHALQAAIAVMTLAAVWLLTDPLLARWGHVLGLASQPVYIAVTWRARQWGMFIVAVAMCGLWARGIVNHF